MDRGLFESRAKAQAAILAGTVFVAGEKSDKAGRPVPPDAGIEVRSKSRWVGRGAEKLSAALDRFGLSCRGRICLDIGAGSGGFTQVLLDRGAARVYAVDVGYGQFDARLRPDPRLVLLERKNARTLTTADVPPPVDFLAMDVSFISVFKILPAIIPLLSPAAEGVILFKPNFEAARGEVRKGGLLLDPAIHTRLLTAAAHKLADLHLFLADLIPSPLRGGDGNIEYLLKVSRANPAPVPPESVACVVAEAF